MVTQKRFESVALQHFQIFFGLDLSAKRCILQANVQIKVQTKTYGARY
jgi:hypothetical protein